MESYIETFDGEFLKCINCQTLVAEYRHVFVIPGYGRYEESFGVAYQWTKNVYERDNDIYCAPCNHKIGVILDGVSVFWKDKVLCSD